MKKFISLLSIVMLICMTACGSKSNEDEKKKTTVAEGTETTVDETSEQKTEEKSTEEPTTLDKEAIKAEKNAELKAAMEKIKVSVLAKATMPYEDAMINGWGYDSDEYTSATILTMLVEFPDEYVYEDYKGLSIIGESVTGADGKIIPNTYSSTAWRSDDYKYVILLMRVAGDVDPTTFAVEIKGEIYKNSPILVERPFENGGNEVGFDNAIQCFSGENSESDLNSKVVKLKNRHYFVLNRPNPNSYSKSIEDVSMSGNKHCYVLIPLEGGFSQTLTTADATVNKGASVENTDVNVTVNEGEKLDRAPDFQTIITADCYRIITEEEDVILDSDDREAKDAMWDKINEDKDTVIENTSVGIDDGDGNIIYFKFD